MVEPATKNTTQSSNTDRERIWAKMAQMHPEFTHDHDVFDDPWAVEALLLGDFIGWRPFSDAHVMDIGANVGVWTAFCALHDCRVTAYEADKITFDTLNGMLEKTGLDSRVNTVNAAIWKTTGTMPFAGREVNTRARCRNGCLTVAGAGPYGDGDMTPGLFWGNVISQPENSDLVSTVSFGDALGSEQWDCIKMDIEGAEYQVILSVEVEKLKQIKFLQLEFHNGWADEIIYRRLLEKLHSVFESDGCLTSDGPHAGQYSWAHFRRKV